MIRKISVGLLMITGFSLFATAAWALPAFLDQRDDNEQRQDILQQSSEILSKLYQTEPQAKASIQKAYGYATFSNFGMKIFFAGGGSGRGVAVNNKTKEKTFMNMAEIQAGLGLGVKKFMLVWVFADPQSFDRFVNSGWNLGGQASAAAKTKHSGGSYEGAVQVDPGVWVYQLTDAGLALELTASGTKYYKDNDLNATK